MSVSPDSNPQSSQEASITVIRKVKQPDGNYALASGWQFTPTSGTTPSPTITPPSGITGADGTVNFRWQITGTTNITITEVVWNGYKPSKVSVKQDDTKTTFFTHKDNTLNLDINPGNIISCEFFSDRPLTLKPDSLPEAIALQHYETPLSVEGSTPVTFSLVQDETTVAGANRGLPPGITLSPNGLLSGIPTAAGSFSFLVQAQDAEGYTVTRSYTLSVVGSVTTTTSPGNLVAVVGERFTHTIVATGIPAPTFSLEPGAPSGMVIDPTTGEIIWTPSALASYPVTVRVSNGVAPDTLVSLTITTVAKMLYSTTNDRSNAELLQGATVSGSIYVFMEPAQAIGKVMFTLQQTNPERQIVGRPENFPPFDFMGTEDARPREQPRAKPFDTSRQRNGSYTITAAVTPQNSTTIQTMVVPFTIRN